MLYELHIPQTNDADKGIRISSHLTKFYSLSNVILATFLNCTSIPRVYVLLKHNPAGVGNGRNSAHVNKNAFLPTTKIIMYTSKFTNLLNTTFY